MRITIEHSTGATFFHRNEIEDVAVGEVLNNSDRYVFRYCAEHPSPAYDLNVRKTDGTCYLFRYNDEAQRDLAFNYIMGHLQ